jgi:hypothetical protein
MPFVLNERPTLQLIAYLSGLNESGRLKSKIMQPQFYSSMTGQVFSAVWNKYRPAILQLMVASETGAQQYKLFNHEFKALDPKEKKFTFEFQAHKGKALTKISSSTNAKDLLEMLNMSKKASELMDGSTFNFKLDSQFVLHISRI